MYAVDLNDDMPDESGVITTVAIDATGDSSGVIYSTTARTDVPIKHIGTITIQTDVTTAGNWSNAPTIEAVGHRPGILEYQLPPNTVPADSVSGASIDWPNATGIGMFAIGTEAFANNINVSTLTDMGETYIYIPANANSIEYYMEIENISDTPTTAGTGRINSSTNNGTTLSASGGTKEWIGAGTLDISDKSGWTLFDLQLGHVGGGGDPEIAVYNVMARFI